MPGYWRQNATTPIFSECFEKEACMGLFKYPDEELLVDKQYKSTGQCAEGYYGALCSACLPGYFKQSGFSCKECGERVYNIIRLVSIIIIASVAVSVLIRSTIANQSKIQTHSVFIKILMNHMQMIMITSSYDMNWPPEVTDFLQQIAPLMEF
jgi:hypothetical protein